DDDEVRERAPDVHRDAVAHAIPHAYARRRRAQASSETAAARITPLITYCHCVEVPSRLKPLPIVWRKKAPSTARQTAPSPRSSETPPSTIAVITSNSIPRFASHCAVETSETRITPAIPAHTPENANVEAFTTFTRTPASRAASALPPA